jgi:hypothetical protein
MGPSVPVWNGHAWYDPMWKFLCVVSCFPQDGHLTLRDAVAAWYFDAQTIRSAGAAPAGWGHLQVPSCA